MASRSNGNIVESFCVAFFLLPLLLLLASVWWTVAAVADERELLVVAAADASGGAELILAVGLNFSFALVTDDDMLLMDSRKRLRLFSEMSNLDRRSGVGVVVVAVTVAAFVVAVHLFRSSNSI